MVISARAAMSIRSDERISSVMAKIQATRRFAYRQTSFQNKEIRADQTSFAFLEIRNLVTRVSRPKKSGCFSGCEMLRPLVAQTDTATNLGKL